MILHTAGSKLNKTFRRGRKVAQLNTVTVTVTRTCRAPASRDWAYHRDASAPYACTHDALAAAISYFRQGYTNLSYLTSPSSSLHKSFKWLLMRVGLTLMTVNSRQPSLSCCGCTHLKYTANWRRCDKFVHLPSSVKTFFISAVISWRHLLTSSS